MKYFSISKTAQVTTYSVNGEYVGDDMSDLYLQLGWVLGIPAKRLHRAICEDDMRFLTPNEEKIVLEVREFMSGVIKDISDDVLTSPSRVYVASNLNEDRTFVWLHLVA